MAPRFLRWPAQSALSFLLACGCAHEPTSSQTLSTPAGSSDAAEGSSAPPASPPAASLEPSTSGTAPPPSVWGEATHEASFLQAICRDPGPLPGASSRPRACVLRGRVRSVSRTIVRSEDGVGEQGVRALAIELDPDDSVPCRTPLDAAEKEMREPEADWLDRVQARSVLLVGSASLEPQLTPGRALCGWTKVAATPGLNPTGWEGQLSTPDSPPDTSLLAAWSTYFVPSRSRMLARRWAFTRRGQPRLAPVEEGGSLVQHPQLTVVLDGTPLTVNAGAPTDWPAKGLVVHAKSLLTAGATPVFMGKWDGYRFSAVRAPR